MAMYGSHHLWALRRKSPAEARIEPPYPADWRPALPFKVDGELYETIWPHGEIGLAASVDALVKRTAYLTVPVSSCSPARAKSAVDQYGLHLAAAMLEDGMRHAGEVLESFVVVLVSLDPGMPDHGQYVLGDRLMEQGRVEYRRALRDLEQAIRDGWPGWSAKGVQVLEIGAE